MNSRKPPLLLALVVVAAAVSACGDKSEEAVTTEQPTEAKPSVSTPGQPVAPAPDKETRLANAVVTGKSAAAVDLKYEILAKPDVGQPFEVDLVFRTRGAADALEVEVSGMPGLTVVSGGSLNFADVKPGDEKTGKLLVQGSSAGLYYIGIAAKMVSRAQTEVRMFSIPVVVGTPPAAAQKAAPPTDASGQPVQSLPAAETGGPAAQTE